MLGGKLLPLGHELGALFGPAAIALKAEVEVELVWSAGGRRTGLLKVSGGAEGVAVCWMV